MLYDRALNFIPKDVDQLFNNELNINRNQKMQFNPSTFFGPIASGEKIFSASKKVKNLLEEVPKLIGVEMESAGVASAALSSVERTRFITIRGLSDFADSSKNDDWHSIAANSAAAWTFSFLKSAPLPHPNSLFGPSPKQVITSTIDRVELFSEIKKRVDNEDFRTFCFILGIDFDELPGGRKSSRIRELIIYFERRDELEKLAGIWARFKDGEF